MSVQFHTLDDRAAFADILAADRACTPSLRDDGDLLEEDAAFRPAGMMRGLTLGTRAAGVVFVDDETKEASLGWFSATDREAGAALVRAAARLAFSEGATRIVGPQNVSTWRRYRCVVDDGGDGPPPFLLEPVTPRVIADSLADAGWQRHRAYATVRIPHVPVALCTMAAEKAARAGIRFSPLEDRSDDDFVDLVHALAAGSFQKKTGYRAVSRAHVAFLYGGARALLAPGLSFVAHDDAGAATGFVVAWPDAMADTPQTVIKTLGVLPGAPSFLGWALMHRHIEAAVAAGFSHGLYALMEKAGPLLRYATDPARMGGETATIHRRYALFSSSPTTITPEKP
jgi:hypothetical protein